MSINRRRFLQGLGLGASALYCSGIRQPAAAGTVTPPKRLIIVSSSHGSVYDQWKMNPYGLPEGATGEFSLNELGAEAFSRVFEPLYPHRRRMIALEGLSMASAELDLPGYRHEKGWIHAWTGGEVAFTGADLWSSKPSIDQLVARAIARDDRLPSLELTIGEGRPICHGGFAQQLPLEADPTRVWERLFGRSTSTDPLLASQGSVLDWVLNEHQALGVVRRSEDRERLDAHFGLVRELEARIRGLAEAKCDGVDAMSLAGAQAGYDTLFDTMADLVTASFACDVTRVATLSLGDYPSKAFGWGDYLSGDAHNDFAHRIFADPQAAVAMADYNRGHASQLARLVARLEAIPAADGQGSLMDHTLIVWGNELADGWHGYQHYQAVTLGGDWAFKTGRYLKYPYGNTPVPLIVPEGATTGAGVPHQHLLVSVAQAMGLAVDHVGLESRSTPTGAVVDFRGPLKEMFA